MVSKPFSQVDSQLIVDLHLLCEKFPKLVKAVQYAAPAIPEITLESWRMSEYRYYDVPSPFPTLARGLFSIKEKREDEKESEDIRYRIVARGYDKFFNIGEVPWTSWSSLETYTKPPYTLTLKSNGCIIFIAALSPSKLVVTSKHSLGPVEGSLESHAQAGERWLLHHLERAGKTTEQLAEVLWEKNWTAVAELCDDSFEEHVLPYSPENTGLHLHGLNDCSGPFHTQSTTVVDAFAREWGFIITPSFELSSILEVKAFTEDIERSGKWNGEPLEGFVVRTTVSRTSTKDEISHEDGVIASPYPPGSSLFFKVKFDEPYMMYRDWREITKSLLSRGENAKLPKSKMDRPETKVYVEWVKGEIKKHPKLFDGYTKGHGIIATRERFLEWLGTREGWKNRAKKGDAESVDKSLSGKKSGKIVIMPIAVPGVGKTTISVALAELFRFAHTQSDDVRRKKSGPLFIKNVKGLLQDHDVVIADRNNHLRQHREGLRDAVKDMHPPVRLLALNWSLDQPPATIHRICADRILARGANHQSLQGDAKGKLHEGVVWKFLRESEPLYDSEADATIEMDVLEGLEDSLARAIDGVVRVLGLARPDVEQVGIALAKARAYKPELRSDVKSKQQQQQQQQQKKRQEQEQEEKEQQAEIKKEPPPPRYFALLAEIDLVDALDTHITTHHQQASSSSAASPATPLPLRDLWEKLKAEDRVARLPHVTIVHGKELPEKIALWERCVAMNALPRSPSFLARLSHVVANERIMAVTVEDLRVDHSEEGEGEGEGYDEGQEGSVFVSQLGADAELILRMHMTIGTRDASVLPVEAGEMVEAFRRGGKGGMESVRLEKDVFIKGRIKGR